jgi:phytoene dehydrogenase-like protein
VHTYFLESVHCGSNGWPTIVIPSVVAPALAPEGHHVLHATITEDFEPWKTLSRGSREYNARKEQRAEILWDFVRKVCID